MRDVDEEEEFSGLQLCYEMDVHLTHHQLKQLGRTRKSYPIEELKNVILLDCGSTFDSFCNPDMVKDIEPAEHPLIMNTNSGTKKITSQTWLPGGKAMTRCARLSHYAFS